MNPSVPAPSSSPCSSTTTPKRYKPRSSNGSPRMRNRRCAGWSRRSCRRCTRLTPELRLPLVSMVVPTLRRLSRDQFQTFVAGVRELIQADNQVSLYEYALQRLLLRHLAPHFGIAPASRAPSRSAGLLDRTGTARPGDPRPHRRRAAVRRRPRLRPGDQGPRLARSRSSPCRRETWTSRHSIEPWTSSTPPRRSSSGRSSTPARRVSARTGGSPSRKASCSGRSPTRWDARSRRSSRSRVARRSTPIPLPDGRNPLLAPRTYGMRRMRHVSS